ncbi:hypothetical protein [Dactylosporangium sp. NPDC051484]|uniref:hypothetical protein n=1 Tax=Dactylosporangium sp. NPDC051484 TaxID=3154942 RepID=UPI00344BEA9A
MAPLRLAVIIGSTREGRAGETIGRREGDAAGRPDGDRRRPRRVRVSRQLPGGAHRGDTVVRAEHQPGRGIRRRDPDRDTVAFDLLNVHSEQAKCLDRPRQNS